MDTTQAQALIAQTITERSNEVTALQLAVSILANTYKPQFDSLAASKDEADQLAGELSTVKTSLTDTQLALANEQTAHATDNATNEATIATLTATNTDIQSKLDDATKQVTDLTAQVATLAPDAVPVDTSLQADTAVAS